MKSQRLRHGREAKHAGIPGLLLLAQYYPSSLGSTFAFGLLIIEIPQLWLIFGPWVPPALRNSDPHQYYKIQGWAIRGEGLDFGFSGVCFHS